MTNKKNEFEIEMYGRKLSWAEQIARMLEMRTVQKALVGKPQENRQFRKVRHRYKKVLKWVLNK
jgi:hypothetical protein